MQFGNSSAGNFRRRNPVARRRPRRTVGFTLIEVLIAGLIVSVCLATIVSTWYFSFRLSINTDAQGVASSIGRKALEEIKETGFQDTAEGSSTVYYDSQGGNKSAVQTSAHAYSVKTVVSTDTMNGAVPAPAALRTVAVTVTVLNSGQTVFQKTTYLARAGI